MQWESGPNAGFSDADTEALYLPVIDDPIFGFGEVNVAAQEKDPSSLLNLMRRLVAVRKRHPCFGRGRIELIETGNHAVLAYRREYLAERVLAIHNFTDREQAIELTRGGVDLLTNRRYSSGQLGLKPYEYLWLLE
jgi:maltose alpha-D-glucosyltransferase/alpha-amylase